MEYNLYPPVPKVKLVPAIRLRVGEVATIDSATLPVYKTFGNPTWTLSVGGFVTIVPTANSGAVIVTATAAGICYLIATIGTQSARMFIEVILNEPDIIVLTNR